MSLTKKWAIDCTKCGLLFETEVWASINTASPELVRIFLQGSLNIVTCPKCGSSTFVPSPVLYNDLDRGLWVTVNQFLEPPEAGSKFDVGIRGVRYRRRPDRNIQAIVVDSFASARYALRNIDDKGTVNGVRKSHPDWSNSMVFAEVFLCHYKDALSSAVMNARSGKLSRQP